jgi:hypothetical protein
MFSGEGLKNNPMVSGPEVDDHCRHNLNVAKVEDASDPGRQG